MELREKMQLIFELVQDPEDWKAPIDAVIDREMLAEVVQSIHFFTGTEVSVERVSETKVRVRSIGYRNGPAGP